jgi:predicted membrane channel-forming protein YqfA (hemolysin III family)
MPRLSQIMIRTALVWLALGYSFGGLVLFTKGAPLLPWLWALRAAHIHMLLVGWTVQLACGVAYWILPRLDASGDRGDERVVRASALALNGGVVLGVVQSIASTWPPAEAMARWLLLLVGLLYATGALLFAGNAWPRVRPFGVVGRQREETK